MSRRLFPERMPRREVDVERCLSYGNTLTLSEDIEETLFTFFRNMKTLRRSSCTRLYVNV
jgi:hypothetical protein